LFVAGTSLLANLLPVLLLVGSDAHDSD
jgi:hypothetical protein